MERVIFTSLGVPIQAAVVAHDLAVTPERGTNVDIAIQAAIAGYWAHNPDAILELAIRLRNETPEDWDD